jgi:hypothetical protein
MFYFYTDANGQKVGPYGEQHLKQLVKAGIIGPQTPMETDTGYTGIAGQIPGLFGVVPVPPQTVPPTPKQLFCTNCGATVSEQAVACMSCGAKPVGHRKFCRQCAVALGPEQVVCVKCGAKTSTNAVGDFFGGNSSSPQAKPLNTFFMLYWILAAVAISLSLITDFMALIPPLWIVVLIITFLISLPTGIAGTVCAYILLYKLWKLIPSDIARTTPGKAVGFCFIPFFNFYWAFVAWKGLGADLNKTLRQCGIQQNVSEGLGLTYSILFVVCCSPLVLLCMIPFFGTFFSAGMATVSILFLKSAKDGAIALLEQRGA